MNRAFSVSESFTARRVFVRLLCALAHLSSLPSSFAPLRNASRSTTRNENICDENILGFQIPMHDALLMRSRKAVRDLNLILNRVANWNGPVLQPLAKRLAMQQSGNDVG